MSCLWLLYCVTVALMVGLQTNGATSIYRLPVSIDKMEGGIGIY